MDKKELNEQKQNEKPKYRKPESICSMTKEELDMELEKGYQDILKGKTKSLDEVFESLKKEFNI